MSELAKYQLFAESRHLYPDEWIKVEKEMYEYAKTTGKIPTLKFDSEKRPYVEKTI